MKLFRNFITRYFLIFVALITSGVIGACNYISTRDVQRTTNDIQAETNQKLTPTFDSIHEKIFTRYCISCHSPGKPAHQVLLDKDSLLNSPLDLIIPGNAEESGLVIAVAREDKKRMPPPEDGFESLKPEEISAIKIWIKNGAKD